MSLVVIYDYIEKQFIKELVDFLDPQLQQSPKLGVRGAIGYKSSAEATAVGSTTPAIEGYEGTEHEKTVRKLEDLYVSVRIQMEKYFNLELDLVNCSYQELTKGGDNPLHADSTKLDGTPWRDDGIPEELEYSALLYLNEGDVDYTGGQIEFPIQNISIVPKPGQLIFFKGDLNHIHEVKVVTSGARKNLVFFFARKGNTSDLRYFEYA